MFNFFKKSQGILGINARNLLYVSRYNTSAAKKFADNKLYTKKFLQSRKIGVAKLYQVIKSYPELQNLDLKTLPQSFVVKPNRGYGGEGILVIHKHKDSTFISVSGEKLSLEELYYHCIDILDGKYAISGTSDQVIIEECLENHSAFQNIVTEGLPDLRIIVFNYVPVIAMLRIPTLESHGKANLHLGAIGVGVDIGTGKTTYGILHNQYVRKFPNGESINSFNLPHWEEILLMASRIQQFSKIGYLAVDLAITKTGIKILEVNARAGLSVQIANRAFLKTRLEKVRDLKIVNPAQGVEVAKTLFSEKIPVKPDVKLKPVIGLFESATLLLDKNIETVARINPHGLHNLIDKNIVLPKQKIFDLLLKQKRLRLTFRKVDLSHQKYKIIIAGKYLGDYLIDCKRPFPLIAKKIKEQDVKILNNIDRKISKIDTQIHLLSILKPRNLTEEKKTFLENPISSPQFIYKTAKTDFDFLKKELDKIPQTVNHPLFGLYQRKIIELKHKISLIQSLNTPALKHYSEKLFGKTDKKLAIKAQKFIKTTELKQDNSPILRFKDTLSQIEQFLKKYQLSHWKINLLQDSPTDMQVNKNNTIFLKENVRFTENRLKALLAHEIGTHIFRFENGKQQPFALLARGTADYLTTEEGLAIYNQNRLGLAYGEKTIWPALNVLAAYYSNRLSFVDLFHYLQKTYILTDEVAWKLCVKTKRGLADTNQKFAFNKDIIYFKGENIIHKFLKNPKNSLHDLYIGKISVNDITILKSFQNFKVKYFYNPET